MRLFAALLTRLFGEPRRVGPLDDPLMLRWHLGRWFGRDYRVHHLLRADAGPDPHDHPYAFTSRVLRGWLVEVVYHEPEDEQWGRWSRFRTGLRRESFLATHIHLITKVSPGGCWTLVSARASGFGPGAAWERGWGFWTSSGFVPYDRYAGGGR